jgi:hypothetical protein
MDSYFMMSYRSSDVNEFVYSIYTEKEEMTLTEKGRFFFIDRRIIYHI